MSTHENNQVCAALVMKVISGQRLDETEKGHLANCEGCMEELVGKLDEATGKEAGSIGLAHTRPEVRRALENARQVFAREFGISIPGK